MRVQPIVTTCGENLGNNIEAQKMFTVQEFNQYWIRTAWSVTFSVTMQMAFLRENIYYKIPSKWPPKHWWQLRVKRIKALLRSKRGKAEVACGRIGLRLVFGRPDKMVQEQYRHMAEPLIFKTDTPLVKHGLCLCFHVRFARAHMCKALPLSTGVLEGTTDAEEHIG